MRRARYSITVGSVYDGHNPLLPKIGPKDHKSAFSRIVRGLQRNTEKQT